MSQCSKWMSKGTCKRQAVNSMNAHTKQELDVLIAMTAMQKSNGKMIKNLTKATIC